MNHLYFEIKTLRHLKQYRNVIKNSILGRNNGAPLILTAHPSGRQPVQGNERGGTGLLRPGNRPGVAARQAPEVRGGRGVHVEAGR